MAYFLGHTVDLTKISYRSIVVNSLSSDGNAFTRSCMAIIKTSPISHMSYALHNLPKQSHRSSLPARAQSDESGGWASASTFDKTTPGSGGNN